MPTPDDEQLYLDATQEVDSGTPDPALWAKAMALDKGDEGKARYRYIALRVEQLSKAPASAPPEDPAPITDSSDDGSRSKPDNSASQTPDAPAGNAPTAPEDSTSSAALSSRPASKYDKRIPEGWVLLTGDEAYVNDWLERIRVGTAAGITVDGTWYVPADQSLLSKSPSTPIIQTKQWSVFIHPIYGQKIAPHTERKNWVAFFFSPIWHIVTRTRHGLWLLLARGVCIVVFEIFLSNMRSNLRGYDPTDDFVFFVLFVWSINIAFACIWLFKANTFRQKSLEARGYKLEDIIEARTKDEALAKLKSAS